ncbi:DDE-type integrase/transposase/recombinase [Vibrio sp. nBUS_14]|uniref:DDE-type integrase/transposase/recombinase n=1 Tax=unclassified Vibrio TaxID=2614977 RepID=UPI003EBAA1DE
MKYLNNGIESNHSPTKNLIETTGGFNMREQAWSTIQDFVGIRVLNKSQIDRWLRVMSRN